MEENLIDIAEILKSYQSGTKLYSPICGECKLDRLCYNDDVITVVYRGRDKSNYTSSELYDELDRNYVLCFDKYGRYKTTDRSDTNGEIMLFPSKNCRDWDTMRVTPGFNKGDFLKDSNGNIFICKEAIPGQIPFNYIGNSFCVLFNNGAFKIDNYWVWKDDIIGYADETEKQKLITAISESGYIWDAEKHELRKKEQEFKVIAEESDSKCLDGFEYSDRLQRFYHDNCESCGSQRCTGVYDEDLREGCQLYKKEFCSNEEEPGYEMNTETVLENRNVSPLLYGAIDSKKREVLLKRLEELYNTLGIDTEFNTPDYLLAEYTLNCLVSYGNMVANKNVK